MIWEEEIRRQCRNREINAFVAGVLVACVGIVLLAWGIVTITGGRACL